MGASSSKSSGHVVIEPSEDDSFNVVHVSDDVVRRFRGIRSLSPMKSDQPPRPPQSPTNEKALESSTQLQQRQAQQASLAQQLQMELIRSKNEENQLRDQLNSVEAKLKTKESVFREKDDKLKEAELKYQQQLAEFMQKQALQQEETATKFKENLENVCKKHFDSDRSKFCLDLETQVIQCYATNASRPLKCSDLVKKFSECVEFHKEQFSH